VNVAVNSVGVYGKLPSQGDFVRINTADPTALALAQWLEEGHEAVRRSGTSLPPEPLYFAFRTAANRSVLLGTLAPSTDSVGRVFPIAVFAAVDAGPLAGRFPTAPVAYAHFLAQAAALVSRPDAYTSAQLAEAVRALPLPTGADFATADQTCRRTLDSTIGAEVTARLFGDGAVGRQYYGLRTFVDACTAVRGKEPPKASVTLECPIASDVDLFAWLEMARRVLRWTDVPPPFFWSEGEAPKLLLTLGPPPSAVLLYVSKPDHGSAKVWPVLTERADAIATARQALTDAHRRAIDDPNTSLETLLATLAS
jgi:type VI secretion system protein ImpM